MDAVTTTEYVVLEQFNSTALQHEINAHAKQGYKLTSFNSTPTTSHSEGSFTAVMVREPQPSIIAALEQRIEKLERQQKWHIDQLDQLQDRCKDIEAKIDWSK